MSNFPDPLTAHSHYTFFPSFYVYIFSFLLLFPWIFFHIFPMNFSRNLTFIFFSWLRKLLLFPFFSMELFFTFFFFSFSLSSFSSSSSCSSSSSSSSPSSPRFLHGPRRQAAPKTERRSFSKSWKEWKNWEGLNFGESFSFNRLEVTPHCIQRFPPLQFPFLSLSPFSFSLWRIQSG